MIKVTKINDDVIAVNADIIEFIEVTPDTMITLTTGRKVIVKESLDTVIEKIVDYRCNCNK